MSVARATNIGAASPRSFDGADKEGIERATRTSKNVEIAQVQERTATVVGGTVTACRVNM